jgi:hypothetical protein
VSATLLDREELAWAAGLYDGEGCTSWVRADHRQPSMSVAMTTEADVRRFHAAVGGLGTVVSRTPPSLGEFRPQWRWRAGGRWACQAVVALLWFKLGQEKRDQYRKVVATCL